MVHQKEPTTKVAGSFLLSLCTTGKMDWYQLCQPFFFFLYSSTWMVRKVVTVYNGKEGLTLPASVLFLFPVFQQLNSQRNGSVYRATNEGEQQKQFTQFQYTITSCLKCFNWQCKQWRRTFYHFLGKPVKPWYLLGRFVPKCGTNHNDDAMINITAFGAVHIYQEVK